MRRRKDRGPRNTKHSVALSVLAGLLNIGANIALFPVVVSQIGADQYGIWLFMLALAAYFFYTDIGIGTAIVYFASGARDGKGKFSNDALISNGLAWVCCMIPIVVPVFFVLGYGYARTHGATTGLSVSEELTVALIGCGLVASIALRPYESVLIGSGYMLRDRINQIIGTGLRVVIILGLLPFGLTLVQVAAAEALGLGIPPLLALIYVRQTKMARFRRSEISRANLRGMFSYSLKSFMVDSVQVATMQAGTLIVGIVGGPASAAYFATATRVYNGAGQVLNWATAPVRPVFSRLSHLDRTTAVVLIKDLLAVVGTVGSVVVIPLALSSVIWVPLWVPDDGVHLGMVACTILMLVALLSRAVQLPVILSGDSFGRPGIAFPAVLTSAIIVIGSAIPLTMHFGITGAATAVAIGLWAVQPWCVNALRKSLEPDAPNLLESYKIPLIVTAAGLVGAGAAALLATVLGLHPGWFTWSGFVIGAGAALVSPPGRLVFQHAKTLLNLPM